MPPGKQLRKLRNRLDITTRHVQEHSRKIAEEEGCDEFYVSNAWLTQIENRQCIPSVHKLFSLSAIYHTRFTDLLLLYGVDLERISKHQMALPLPQTHLTTLEVYDKQRTVSFPVRLDAQFRPEKTNLISRIVEIWGEVPMALLQHLDTRRCKYGYIGLEDFTLHPLLRPGSFVQVDDRQNKVSSFAWRSEYERPIYFIELRDGYACSWCELQRNRLTLLPHPLSPCVIRQFAYPTEAEIVGRVTAVAMRLVDPCSRPSEPPERLSAR